MRCFTLDEIHEGRAFTLIDGERLVGLAPDRVLEVEVTAGDRTLRLPVHENAVGPACRACSRMAKSPCDSTSTAPSSWRSIRPARPARNGARFRLRDRLDVTTLADTGNFHTRKRTFVRPTRPEAESLAMRIAMTIGAGLQPTSKAPPGPLATRPSAPRTSSS